MKYIVTLIVLILSIIAGAANADITADSNSESGAASSVYIAGSTSKDNTPSMSAGSNNTVSCAIGKSAALAVPGLGASVGGGKIDAECNTREEALVLRNLVGTAAAIEHLCRNDKSLRETLVSQGYCSAPVPDSNVAQSLYTMCELRKDGKIYISIRHGVDRAYATQQCKASLGY
jgi:hypothetical protein